MGDLRALLTELFASHGFVRGVSGSNPVTSCFCGWTAVDNENASRRLHRVEAAHLADIAIRSGVIAPVTTVEIWKQRAGARPGDQTMRTVLNNNKLSEWSDAQHGQP